MFSCAVEKITRLRLLPSQRIVSKRNRAYSLLRVEVCSPSLDLRMGVWSSLECLGFLDPKDSLFRALSHRNVQDVMPHTILLPWNAFSESDILSRIGHNVDFSQYILKSSLGSGGFGLYFVSNIFDISEVIKGHHKRASSFDGFLDNLAKTYGEIPSWSLQRIISPVRLVDGNRKTQVRVYCVCTRDSMYIYDEIEVRVPTWGEENNMRLSWCFEKQRWKNDVENEYVGEGLARPYNECRMKPDTERYLLDEIKEFEGARASLELVVRRALLALKEDILHQISLDSYQYPDGLCSLAIAGIDLVVDRDPCSNSFRSFIVEINNNPAMPGMDKKMSEAYRQHLPTFVKNIMMLGLSRSCEKFSKVW